MRLSRSRTVRTALAIGAVALLVAVATGWRWVYVSWQLRSARHSLDLGDSSQVAAALGVLKKAEGIESPDRAELLYLRGRAERRAGDLNAAFKYLKRAQERGWSARQVEEQIQFGMFQRARFDQPGPTIDQLIARNSSDAFAYELYEALSKGYLHGYRFKEALQSLDHWIAWRPQDVDPHLWRAGIWERMQSWEQAIAEYQQILKFHPRHFDSQLAIARIRLAHLNQAEDARSGFEICLKLRPGDVASSTGMAECEHQTGGSELAEHRLRSLLARELSAEQRAGIQVQLATILFERRDLTEARELLLQAIESEPLNGPAHYSLALVLAAEGRRDEADKYFERSKVLEAQFNRLTDITGVLATHPERVDLRWEAGKILMDQGMQAEGAGWMATALMYDPDHRQTHESLAEYYESVKHDPELAQRHRAKAREAAEKNTP